MLLFLSETSGRTLLIYECVSLLRIQADCQPRETNYCQLEATCKTRETEVGEEERKRVKVYIPRGGDKEGDEIRGG